MSGNDERAGRRFAAGPAPSVEPYREEMWAVVSRSWSEQAARRRGARAARSWSAAGLGLAAMLIVGVFVGRWSTGVGDDERRPAAIIADSVSVERPIAMPYRIAVGEHFREAETLLVLFESSERADAELVELARELAARSRMLMTSHVGRDADVRAMLLDLELLLVQISLLVDDDDSTEMQIVRDSVEESEALARLRRMASEEARAAGI